MELTANRLNIVKRKPKRLTITLSHAIFEQVHYFAFVHGRSASNLGAYLIEHGIEKMAEAHH